MWIKKWSSGIRWKLLLTFLGIIGVSFAVTAALLTRLVSSTLYAQRTRQASLSAERLASLAAPFFAADEMETLREALTEAADESGERILLLTPDGTVRLDTLSLAEGATLELPEVAAALSGDGSPASGLFPAEGVEEASSILCAASMTEDGAAVGVLLLSAPVAELRQAIDAMESQLVTVFSVIAAATAGSALIFSFTLTRPIKALTAAIRRMGRGDLSVRARIRASGELRELAESCNAMADKIETLDRSRSQFISDASHELKTPLTAAKLLLECLLQQPDMPESLQREFMQDMNHELERLTDIITDLLTLSKIDSANAPLHLTDVDLSALTEQTLHAISPMAERAGLTILPSIAPGVRLTGDATKLSSIVFNLADNAVKYTPEGGEIRVNLAAKGRNILLTVADNGVGIPLEEQPHVFDRFYRVDKARSRENGGTGLGLSIVQQVVQLHGGQIALTSAPGEGSAFTVTLPLKKDAE